MPEPGTRTIDTHGPYDLASTFALLSMGAGDPCLKVDSPQQLRLALCSPNGPAAIQVQPSGASLVVTPIDDQSDWLMEHTDVMLGAGFQPPHIDRPAKLRHLSVRHAGMRLPRLPTLSLRLVQVILQQLVSFRDACAGWRSLVRRYGVPVPGQPDLHYPPSPAKLTRLTSHQFIECGVLPQHGRRIVEAMRHAKKIEASWGNGHAGEAVDRTCDLLGRLPGIGPWTLGFLRGAGMGDPDAVVPGDYSHPQHVSHFFGGPADADDEAMLRLLEPYRPYRFYVLALLVLGAPRRPRRGPRRQSLRERLR